MLKDTIQDFEWMAVRDNENGPVNFTESYITYPQKNKIRDKVNIRKHRSKR